MPEKLKRTNDGCYFERGVDSIADAAVEAVNAYKHWTNSDEGGAPVDRAIDTLKATLTTEGFAEEVEEVEEVEEGPWGAELHGSVYKVGDEDSFVGAKFDNRATAEFIAKELNELERLRLKEGAQ